MTLYWAGIREGECLALTPKKVLDNTQSLFISETFKRKDGEDIFDNTKNNNVREVSMPDFLHQELRYYMNALYGLGKDDRIFYFTKTALNKGWIA